MSVPDRAATSAELAVPVSGLGIVAPKPFTALVHGLYNTNSRQNLTVSVTVPAASMPQRASTKGNRTAYDAERQKQRTSRARAAKEEKEQRCIAASTAEERALEIGAEKKRKRELKKSKDRLRQGPISPQAGRPKRWHGGLPKQPRPRSPAATPPRGGGGAEPMRLGSTCNETRSRICAF